MLVDSDKLAEMEKRDGQRLEGEQNTQNNSECMVLWALEMSLRRCCYTYKSETFRHYSPFLDSETSDACEFTELEQEIPQYSYY